MGKRNGDFDHQSKQIHEAIRTIKENDEAVVRNDGQEKEETRRIRRFSFLKQLMIPQGIKYIIFI